jgi:hypothetical protein
MTCIIILGSVIFLLLRIVTYSKVVHQVLVLLELVDPELSGFIKSAQLQPYYGLSWILTWFAHDVDELETIARLFDYFLASHPYSPLYLSVAVIVHNRERMLRFRELVS